MRLIEIALVLTNVLTLLLLTIPQLRAIRGIGWLVLIPLLIAFAQVMLEGSRWQMIPSYGLTGLFCLVWLLQNITSTDGFSAQTWVNQLAVGLGVLGLVVAFVLPLMLPVFRFPKPSGSYQIGTLTYHWKDLKRPEIFSADPNARRELMVQIWYPASGNLSSPHAPYMQDADAVMTAFAGIQQRPKFLFEHFKYVRTNAFSSAVVSNSEPSYPVLLFLEGATGFRQMNTFQVEELVSHGYIVVALDQPGAAAAVVFPDGHQLLGLPVKQLQALIRPSYLPDKSTPILNGRTLEGDSIIPYLAQDVIFALDRLTDLNHFDPNGILTGRLDLKHVGVFGVSLGGIVAPEACHLEPRLKACLMMDAPVPSDVVRAGLSQPSMWITRDADDMRLERQRLGGWSEVEIQAHQTSMRATFEGLAGAGYFVQIPGTFHSNFMDVPNWLPLSSALGLSGSINARRAHDIINAYSLAFFDQHLKHHPRGQLEKLATQYPEVIFESHQP